MAQVKMSTALKKTLHDPFGSFEKFGLSILLLLTYATLQVLIDQHIDQEREINVIKKRHTCTLIEEGIAGVETKKIGILPTLKNEIAGISYNSFHTVLPRYMSDGTVIPAKHYLETRKSKRIEVPESQSSSVSRWLSNKCFR